MRGILIDIEGGDGSGKTDQAKLLLERLQKNSVAAVLFDFPRYADSYTGKLTGEFLAGKHGDFMSVSPFLSALPYALDRAGAREQLEEALSSGKVIVSNRYTPSNLAHQSAKLPSAEQPELVATIEHIEYDDLRLPRPDIVFYLSVPTDISSDLIGKKEKRDYLGEAGGRDLAERNIAHQDRTRTAYLRLAADKGWHVIECAPQKVMRSREEIHNDIWRIVESRLPR
jgi:dTMP kinase